MTHRILEIKLGALGDFVLTTGAMKTLREHHKEAHITLLTTKPFVKMAEQSGYFDTVIVDPRSRNPVDWWRICKKTIADGNFDIVYDFQNNKRTKKRYFALARLFYRKNLTWACWTTGGFDVRHVTKTHRFSWGQVTHKHMPMDFYPPALDFMHGDQAHFHELPEKYVLLIPGCSKAHPYKRWPAESYAALARRLAERGIQSVILGTDEEKDAAEIIIQTTPTAINFLNKAQLMDIPALAKKATAVVGNDTGPTHMAALAGQPCLYLFSERTRKSANWFPNITNLFGEHVSDITVDQVMHALTPHLNL